VQSVLSEMAAVLEDSGRSMRELSTETKEHQREWWRTRSVGQAVWLSALPRGVAKHHTGSDEAISDMHWSCFTVSRTLTTCPPVCLLRQVVAG